MAQQKHTGVVVRYTQRHLNVEHTSAYALRVQEHARWCFEVMKELKNDPTKLPAVEGGDISLLALWHDAVNTAVSVYYLVGWDADLHRIWGVPDDVSWLFAQEKGWQADPDFGQWVGMRLHLTHILQWESVDFPLREALPVAYPPRGSGWDKRYIHTSNFDKIPDEGAIKRFDQFLSGLVQAIFDWRANARAEADKEAAEWFNLAKVQDRKSKHQPFRVSDAITHCEPRLVEKLLTELTRDIAWGRGSTRHLATYRYAIKKAIRRTGALEARFRLEWLNAQPNSREMVLLNWQDYVEARLEALHRWMVDAGGGPTSNVMQYSPKKTRYFEILANVYAERHIRLDKFITFCYNEFTRPTRKSTSP